MCSEQRVMNLLPIQKGITKIMTKIIQIAENKDGWVLGVVLLRVGI